MFVGGKMKGEYTIRDVRRWKNQGECTIRDVHRWRDEGEGTNRRDIRRWRLRRLPRFHSFFHFNSLSPRNFLLDGV